MYRFINLSFVGLLGALTVIGSGTPAFGQEFVDDDARFDQRTGASGFFAPGAALIRINGNSLYAPDFSVGVGGQWTTGAAYGVASGATGVTDQGVRITFLSLGIFIEGREDRFRFGAGLQPYLWFFDRPTTNSTSFNAGLGVTGRLAYDILEWSGGELFLAIGMRAAVMGTGIDMYSPFAKLGIRW